MGGYYSANNVSGFSNLNIGFEFGSRGINSERLVKETFWAVRIGLSLNDLWFIKESIIRNEKKNIFYFFVVPDFRG